MNYESNHRWTQMHTDKKNTTFDTLFRERGAFIGVYLCSSVVPL
jgi:hypothetical protein